MSNFLWGVTYPLNPKHWNEDVRPYLGSIVADEYFRPPGECEDWFTILEHPLNPEDEDYWYYMGVEVHGDCLLPIRHCDCEYYSLMNKGCRCGGSDDEKQFKETHKERSNLFKLTKLD